MSSYHYLDNPYGVVKTQSKTLRQQHEAISNYNHSVKLNNDARKMELKYSNTPVLLLCPMCEGVVRRRIGTKKNKTVQIGFQSFVVPSYKCSVCGNCFSGHLPHVVSDNNKDLECKIVSGIQ